jgi:hypothetical protein
MEKQASPWIDHRKAVIVFVTDGDGLEDGSTEDVRDRQFGNHLTDFYERVSAGIRDAETIQIFGTGEAKGGLRKRLDHDGCKRKILAVETMDKMTDRLISAKVQERYSG